MLKFNPNPGFMAVGTCMNKIVISVSVFVNLMKGLQLREWGHTNKMVDLLLQKVSAVGVLVTPRFSIYVRGMNLVVFHMDHVWWLFLSVTGKLVLLSDSDWKEGFNVYCVHSEVIFLCYMMLHYICCSCCFHLTFNWIYINVIKYCF